MRRFGAVLLMTLVGCGATVVTHREDAPARRDEAEACLPAPTPVIARAPRAVQPPSSPVACPICGGQTVPSQDRDHELQFHRCEACNLVLTRYPDGSTFAAVRRGDSWTNYRSVGRSFLPVESDPPTASPVYEETSLVEERIEEPLERIAEGTRRGRTGLWAPRRGVAIWVDRNGQRLPIPSIDLTEWLGHPIQLPGHPIWLPGPPIERPGHPVTRPGHPVTRPDHPISRPDHFIQRPGHPVRRPSHSVTRPNHSVERPGHPVQLPGAPIVRPTHGPIMFRPGHPVGRPATPSNTRVIKIGYSEPEPPRGSAARIQRREAKIAQRQASRQGGSFARTASRGGGSFARARR